MSLSREKLAQLKRKSKAVDFFGGENSSKAIINKYIFDGGTPVEPIKNDEIREADNDVPSIKAISSKNIKIKYITGKAIAPEQNEEILSFRKLPRGSLVDIFDVIPESTLKKIVKGSPQDLLSKEYNLAILDKIKKRVNKIKAKTGPIKLDDSELEKKLVETYNDELVFELDADKHIEKVINLLKLSDQVEDREDMEKDVKLKNRLESEIAKLEKDIKKPNQENKSKKEADLASAKKKLEEHNKYMGFREKALEEYYNNPDGMDKKEKKEFINDKVKNFKVEERKKKDPEEDKKRQEEEARKLVEDALDRENNRKVKLAEAGLRGAAREEAEKAALKIKAEAEAKAGVKRDEEEADKKKKADAAAEAERAAKAGDSGAPEASGADAATGAKDAAKASGADAATGAKDAAKASGADAATGGGGKKRNTRNKRKTSGKTRRKRV